MNEYTQICATNHKAQMMQWILFFTMKLYKIHCIVFNIVLDRGGYTIQNLEEGTVLEFDSLDIKLNPCELL